MPTGSDEYAEAQLIVVAPETLWDILGTGLAPLYQELELFPRLEAAATNHDPYGLVILSKALSPRPAGILLVAPRSRSPARLIPAPVLNGIPIGIVQADSEAQIKPWLSALYDNYTLAQNIIWSVLAMWKNIYLKWGERFALWMQSGISGKEVEVQTWFADTVSREDMCNHLATGPRLVIYTGHGRARGLSGYRGVRWDHITDTELRKPCGVFICLSCDTLKRARGIVPFGCRLVSQGRTCAYVGSVDRVGYKANAAFAYLLGQLFSKGHCQTIGQLLREVDENLEQKPYLTEAKRAFLTYRLIGSPLQSIYGETRKTSS